MQRGGRIRHLWLLQLASDLAAVSAAYFTTFFLRFRSELGQTLFSQINRILGVDRTGELGETMASFYLAGAFRIILLMTVVLCILYALNDLYPGRRFLRKRPEGWHILVSNITALLLFFAYFYLSRNIWHPRTFFGPLLIFNTFYCVGFRGLLNDLLAWIRTRLGMDRCRAVLAGSPEETYLLQTLIDEWHPHGIYIVDRITFANDEPFETVLNRLRGSVRDRVADMIIVADKTLSIPSIMAVLELADSLGVMVKALSDKMEVLQTRAHLPVDTFGGVPLVHFEAPCHGRLALLTKQALAYTLAWVLLLLLLPLMGLIALLVRLSGPGGVLFVQERVGVNRKPFRLLKFRTMYDRADELQAQLEEFNQSGEGLFKIRKDPRVTPVGRFLRRFSLDELPQLINVIRGEMTIVGPRPLPRRDFENYYEEWHYSRHGGMPGLTCLWQISGRSDIDFHNMCILDVYYLRNQSWVLDLKIGLKTVWVVLFAKGAY